jgi:uncharacterized phage protein gp47/JayE
MPWSTPTLKQVRIMVRDDITAAFNGGIIIGNSVLRVMSDAMSGLGHLTLRYIDWLARQFLPDTSEKDWLDRHADIWLVNADGSTGRKNATFATGTFTMTGVNNSLVASGTSFQSSIGIGYETTQQITIGATATPVAVRAIDAGAAGNLEPGETVDMTDIIGGVDSTATVVEMSGGIDDEEDTDVRSRVLFRIQQPPMGGDASDFVVWATAVAGVTRAWAAPLEMGMGTVTIRFMMDDFRAASNGFPLAADILNVTAYIDSKRPVAIKDRWVLSPIPEPIDFIITELADDTVSIRSAIEVSVRSMLREKAAPAHAVNGVLQPAQTIYASWVSEAIINVQGVNHFKLIMEDHVMPTNGHIGILGTVVYG